VLPNHRPRSQPATIRSTLRAGSTAPNRKGSLQKWKIVATKITLATRSHIRRRERLETGAETGGGGAVVRAAREVRQAAPAQAGPAPALLLADRNCSTPAGSRDMTREMHAPGSVMNQTEEMIRREKEQPPIAIPLMINSSCPCFLGGVFLFSSLFRSLLRRLSVSLRGYAARRGWKPALNRPG
jgi:hypothetical protein